MKGLSKSGLVTDKVVVFFGVFFAIFAILYRGTSVGAAVPNMFTVFSTTTSAITTSNRSQWREWTGAAWSTASSTSMHGADMQQVVVKSARFKEEYIFAGLDSMGYLTAQVYNGTLWTPTTTIERLVTVADSAYRSFDLEYENGTDRALLVTRGGDKADPVYRIWDGSSWSATSTIDIPTTGAIRWIELASQRFSTSTKIAMITMDANSDIYGMEWDGTSWSAMGDAAAWDTDGTNATKKGVDVAYESASGAAIFAWGDASADGTNWRKWDGTTLTALANIDITGDGGDNNWIRLAANTYSATNTIMLGVSDAGIDINTAFWTGSTWLQGTTHDHDSAAENILNMSVDVEFIKATTSGKAWLSFGDGATVSRRLWNGNAWGTAATAGDDAVYIQLESSYEKEGMFEIYYEDNGATAKDIMGANNLNPSATTWTTPASIFPGPVVLVATSYFRMDMTPSRYYTYPTFTQSAYRWFANDNSTSAGAILTAAQDQVATTTADGQAFRLRMLLHTATATSTAPEHEVSLQFATRSGTCDTSFSGETYATVTPSTAIAFYDNSSVADNVTAEALDDDPGHSGHIVVYQTYEEENGATTTAETIQGRDALWDFSLYDNDGPSTVGSYCFRLVKSSGNLLSTYSVVPEINTYVNPTISAAYNQIFDYGGVASSTALITVTDVGGGNITATNDLRISIATSTLNFTNASTSIAMLWDTSDTQAIFGGSASTSKVSSSVVSYEGGGSVLVVPVASDFGVGDVLTISGLSFKSFTQATSSTAGFLGVLSDGVSDRTLNATTTQGASIRGTLTLANHSAGQISDQWDTQTPTTTVHFRYDLGLVGEGVTLGTTTFSLTGITGIVTSDITSAKLYYDFNGDGIINGIDHVASGTNAVPLYDAVVDISGSSGTIIFATSTRYKVPIWNVIGGNGAGGAWPGGYIEEVSSMATSSGSIYVGLGQAAGDGEVWEYDATSTWNKIGGDGINSSWPAATYEMVKSLTASSGVLYAGLAFSTGDAEVWRQDNSTTWTKIGGDGLNGSWNTGAVVCVLAPYKGHLYAVMSTTSAALVWRWDGSTWTQVGGDGLNGSWAYPSYSCNPFGDWSSLVADDTLYIGTYSGSSGGDGTNNVWSYNGSTWTKIAGEGVNGSWNMPWTNAFVGGLVNIGSTIYAGIGLSGQNGPLYGEVWEYVSGVWTKIAGNNGINNSWVGSSTPEVNGVYSMVEYGGDIYASVGNSVYGGNLWRFSTSSRTWSMVGGQGINGSWVSYDTSRTEMIVSDNRIYVGTRALGGLRPQVWQYGGPKGFNLQLTASNLVAGDTMTVALTTPFIQAAAGSRSLETISPSGSASSVTHAMDSAATAPSISNLSFNSGSAIDLIESTFKWASATLTVTDDQYCNTLNTVTAKAYLASTTNSGTTCSASDLSCYLSHGSTTAVANCVATTTGNTCGASDTTVEYDCGFKFWYVSTPTDTGTWASSIWSVSATATDDGGLTGTATNTSQAVDINSLAAFDISPGYIDYGALVPGASTAASNSTTTVTNTGNTDVDPRLSGTDMTSTDDTLLVGQQEYLADPFILGAGVPLTNSATTLALLLPPPTSTTTPVLDYISWGLGVPSGKRPGTYSGTNTLVI